jgi:hypothetical protein
MSTVQHITKQRKNKTHDKVQDWSTFVTVIQYITLFHPACAK